MSLELKRKQLELARVTMAKNELEFKIEEKMEEVNRLKEHIRVQEQKQNELTEELSLLKNKEGK